MKTLSALVNEFRKMPSEKLKNEIMDFLLNAENPDDLDRIHRTSVGEWRQFGNVRIKQLFGKVYAVTETHDMSNGFMCYAYKVDLSTYSKKEILAYEENCPHFRDVTNDADLFAVLSIASAYDTDNAELCEVVMSESERKSWYEKVDREVK